ncbi:PLS4 scramblase, partial [Crocuta crocuta]
GPPGPAVAPPAGYAGGWPVGYHSPQQPSTFFPYRPAVAAHPTQYQPGKYQMPNQPVPITWMPGPPPIPNCPPGLEYLTQLDTIHVLQHFEPLEMITSFETNNGYDVKNNLDQMVYVACACTGIYVLGGVCAYRCICSFLPSVTASLQLEVQCPPGVTIGFVAEHWNLCRAVYSIQNEKKENVMRVRGPCSTYGCGSDSVFEVKSLDGVSNIGSIIRKWNGLLSAMADADQFEIHFPLDMDVKMKAMIFGACFLI